jgi:formate dehydrogenase (NADP+) beta subunit
VACIGAGPASLTVANDLAPLGYEVVVFEQYAQAGGLMRTNIPAFRLPAQVLDEEIGYIVDMGVDLRLGSPVASMRGLLEQGFDAVFVGTGAPRGKDLVFPAASPGASTSASSGSSRWPSGTSTRSASGC